MGPKPGGAQNETAAAAAAPSSPQRPGSHFNKLHECKEDEQDTQLDERRASSNGFSSTNLTFVQPLNVDITLRGSPNNHSHKMLDSFRTFKKSDDEANTAVGLSSTRRSTIGHIQMNDTLTLDQID